MPIPFKAPEDCARSTPTRLSGPSSSPSTPYSAHIMASDMGPSGSSNTTVHVRGRKRFLADLNELKALCKAGYEVRGLQMRQLRAGDDEGTFECTIFGADDQHLVSLSFVVSVSSNHTFFCFSEDADVPAPVLRAVEAIAEQSARPIQEMFNKLLLALGSKMIQAYVSDAEDSEEEGEDDWETYNEHSDDDYGIVPTDPNSLDIGQLQRDFIETVACGYRPGFVSLGTDDFVLSTSLSIVALARDIPPRALMAWDRRLLARTQHLTLLVSGMRGTYPVLQEDGTLSADATARAVGLHFHVGLTAEYKPLKEHAAEAVRVFGLREERSNPRPSPPEPEPEIDVKEHWHGFQSFSLSDSLETLLNDYFLRVLRSRLRYGIGWAGAEVLCWEAERSQKMEHEIIESVAKRIDDAEEEEKALARSYRLPPDPLSTLEGRTQPNLLLLAFCYLIRRLTLCARYCLVCHSKLRTDYDVLKPYVCDSGLCAYRYYSLNHGSSLEYEICAYPETVDLLVSLAYVAALGRVLDEPLPVRMGLRVVKPSSLTQEMCDFDGLSRAEMCTAITDLIGKLPSIKDMKRHLEEAPQAGRAKRRLKDIDPDIPDAAWLVLRWCVASCTAHLEELRSVEDRVQNIGSNWRQFRFSVGAPDAEAKYRAAVVKAQSENANARNYPSLYAFHGSKLENWHSIIRHGLWYKTVTNGRAYGNGVYFAKDGNTSIDGYARGASGGWKNSAIGTNRCVALAEIVNLPARFVSSAPYFVVADTQWIVCRYLLVDTGSLPLPAQTAPQLPSDIPFVPLDPKHPTTIAQAHIQIPEPSYAIEKILATRRGEFVDVEYDSDDMRIFHGQGASESAKAAEGEAENALEEPTARDADDWTHDPAWVQECLEHLMPPPSEASPTATMAVQRELRMMLAEQDGTRSLRELGWYMPPDLIGDNLFQWIVELHSFDPELPIAQDMAERGVNSVVFELRFPPTFPHAPPFVRILKPRFLPFIQGGGGHITGGGSICMDLLTADGWSPIYNIPGILLQIRMAISNLEPRPARLAHNWNLAYHMAEALDGYKRAAATHGWKIPQGLDRLAR
ncbi:hypothetical protein B0H21DRAFT_759509 [Amylocystis lapponica]|nr:hypothetical protein B0H21DRAFT_759509 [Amylocystis lapponica]